MHSYTRSRKGPRLALAARWHSADAGKVSRLDGKQNLNRGFRPADARGLALH